MIPRFAKWIRCRVPESDRVDFDRAQRAWSALESVPGFVAQFGGFAGTEAVVFGLWADADAHRRFMDSVHDEIVEASGQARSYTTIQVEALRLEDHRGKSWTAALGDDPRVIRIGAVEACDPITSDPAAGSPLLAAQWSRLGRPASRVLTSLWTDPTAVPRESFRAGGAEGIHCDLLPQWTVIGG